MFSKLKKYFFLKLLNKKDIEYLSKLFAVVIYIDREIDERELIEAKKDLKNFIYLHYKLLDEEYKNFITEYFYEQILNELSKFKQNDSYFTNTKNQVINYILSLDKPDYFLNYIKDIIKADGKIVKEEKSILLYLEKYIEGMKYA